MAAAGGPALAAAHGMVHRVHGDAAVVRFPAQPAVAPGLADGDVLMIQVPHLAHGGVALDVHLAHLARGQLDLGPGAVARHELGAAAGAPHHLAALADLELDVVDHRAQGDAAQRQGVADVDLDVLARHHLGAHLQAVRPQDVALLAVGIVQQRDARRAVGIVLDGRHLGRDAVLVPLEVDDAVALLVTAAPPPRRELARVVAPAARVLALGQGLLWRIPGELLEREVRLEPARRVDRLPLLRRHLLHPLEELDRLFTLREAHVGLLPIGTAPDEAALPAYLAVDGGDADLGDLHLELRLDRTLDLDLVGASRDLEGDDVLLVAQLRRLLGDQRAADDLLDSHFASTSTRRLRALSLTTSTERSTTS